MLVFISNTVIAGMSSKKLEPLKHADDLVFIIIRNRVAVQLQKNLDRVRLRRVAAKMKKVTHGGYYISSHPSGLIIATKNLREATPSEDESEENSR